MLDDLRRRLDDLNRTAVGLAELLTDDAGNQLPGMLLARAAVAIDEAAHSLDRHFSGLRQARTEKT